MGNDGYSPAQVAWRHTRERMAEEVERIARNTRDALSRGDAASDDDREYLAAVLSNATDMAAKIRQQLEARR